MSFGLPSIKVKPEPLTGTGLRHEGPYEQTDLMTSGFSSVKSTLETHHPLITSEQGYLKNREAMALTMMRNSQGLHAPLKFTMECNAARKVGHLPFLPSSNVMLEVLRGTDTELNPEDVYGLPEFREVAGMPHAVVERSLGIL